MQAADHAEPHAVLDQRFRLAADRLLEERHQRADLFLVTRPVLRGEAVQSQILDASLTHIDQPGIRALHERLRMLPAPALPSDRGQA